MATTQDCLDAVRNAAGRDLSDAELERIAERLERRLHFRQQARRAGRRLHGLTEDLLAMAADEADKARIEAAVARRNAALNILRRQEIDGFIGQFKDPAEGLQALLVGIARGVRGARQSVDARGKAIERELAGGLLADLRRADLLDLVQSRAIEADIAREMWELGPQGQPGRTGNDAAREIAAIFARYKEAARLRTNRAGGMIGKLDGHIHQSHDAVRVRRAGFEAWAAEIAPRLDSERTFQGDDPAAFLRRVFDDIATGEHIGGAVAKGEFAGQPSLARLISRPRVLHFKSADDWLDYSAAYGQRGLLDGVLGGLHRSARDIAIMERLGPNPRLMFDAVRKSIRDANRDNLALHDRLKGEQLEWMFRVVSGEADRVGDVGLARFMHGLRAVQSMAKLGGAVLSSVSDVGSIAVNTRYRGDSLLSAYAGALRALFRGRGAGEIRDLADDLGVGFEGTIGAVAARFAAEDDLPGTMSKLVNVFFRVSGLAWWTDAQKTGFALAASHSLARQAGQAFAALPARLARVLEQHGIGAREWELMRAHAVREVGGRRFMAPELIADLPDEALDGGALDAGIAQWISEQTVRGKGWPARLAARRREYRDELATRLRSYFTEEADFAVPTAGARERAIITMGQQPGTVSGEVWRSLMQFKSFPITVATRQFGRLVRGQPGGVDVPGVVHMVLAMTALGYGAQSLKELAKGRSPRDPASADTWFAAGLQGGGLGIYGDFLLGEWNRFGRTPLETAAGPTLGAAAQGLEVLSKVLHGDDVGASGLRFALSNTPFANLWYTRAALDYLLIYQIQEVLNPGYLRRFEANVRRQNNQTFLLPPSRVIPRGGGAPDLTAAATAIGG